MMRVLRVLATSLLLAAAAGAAMAQTGARMAGARSAPDDRFGHAAHAGLFVACQTCHLGAAVQGRPLWPTAQSCAACHDGKLQPRVDWTPRTDAVPTNLDFTHAGHGRSVARQANRADSALACGACHQPKGERFMTVARRPVQPCLDCHGLAQPHLEVADAQCATCHVPLPASAVTVAMIRRWSSPDNHQRPDFPASGHGALARDRATGGQAAASCATCHTRDFCADCHVNAPDEPLIMAYGADARGLAVARNPMKAPASHLVQGFGTVHGRGLAVRTAGGVTSVTGKGAQRCQVCHTQQSCLTCHLVPVRPVEALPAAGPGRGRGAVLERQRPVSHGRDFTDAHAAPAGSRPQSCFGCHVRPQCLDCHRPDPAAAAGYHPADYLTRHPAAAYQRETSCSDCHNQGQFCQTCHLQSGLGTRGAAVLGSRANFHDKFPGFAQGHGQVARQSLESCVSCHSERDCLSCHSLIGGRRVSPHGPNFAAQADRLRRSNIQMCSVCHGTAVPGAGP